MVIDGDVPIGSGMSSSAALECAALCCLDKLYGYSFKKLDMARMAQRGEQEFAGVMVGIMDQFASLFGKKDQVVQLDCRSLEYQYRPFNLPGYSLLLLNTNVHHSLASSEYNQRRDQCLEGVALVAENYPEVRSLRDCTVEMLVQCILPHNKETYTRCRYVVEENLRVIETCKALEINDVRKTGELMFRSHSGLSKEYNVSCAELDFLVENVKKRNEVAGARMMGGGFGGCTINIVKTEFVEDIVIQLSQLYKKKFEKELTSYRISIEDGTSIMNL
jgi:galactokinase